MRREGRNGVDLRARVEKNTSSPQTSKEDEPAPVLDWASGRIRQENSEVRALRMVFLRNALHSFITGDGTRTRSGPRSGKTNARPFRSRAKRKHPKSKKTQTARTRPPRARRSKHNFSQSPNTLRESEFVRVFIHGPSGRSGRAGRVARGSRTVREPREGAPSLSPPARRRGGRDRGARAEDAVNFASRKEKLRARFIKDETFVVDASECV